jgi:tetratricopeptide (TPR) repeat protein
VKERASNTMLNDQTINNYPARVGLQIISVIGDVHHAAGQWKKAVASYQQSLKILALSGLDDGSVAANIRKRLIASLLRLRQPEAALGVVDDMLSYARNVHIQEHSMTVQCLDSVVKALVDTGKVEKARPAAEFLLEVRRLHLVDADIMYNTDCKFSSLPQRLMIHESSRAVHVYGGLFPVPLGELQTISP